MKFFFTLVLVSSSFTLLMFFLWYLRRKRRLSDSKNFLVFAVGSLVITIILVICLFNIEREIMDASDSIVFFKCEKVRVGKYSEERRKPGCESSATEDCMETRTWKEPCSEVVWTKMRDHVLNNKDLKGIVGTVDVGRGLICPEDPQQAWDIPEANLDEIVVITTKEYTVDMFNKEGRYYTDTVTPLRYFQLLDDKKQKRRIVIERLGHWVITNKRVVVEEEQ